MASKVIMHKIIVLKKKSVPNILNIPLLCFCVELTFQEKLLSCIVVERNKSHKMCCNCSYRVVRLSSFMTLSYTSDSCEGQVCHGFSSLVDVVKHYYCMQLIRFQCACECTSYADVRQRDDTARDTEAEREHRSGSLWKQPSNQTHQTEADCCCSSFKASFRAQTIQWRLPQNSSKYSRLFMA